MRQFDYICDDTEKLVTGLSDHQFNWRPQPGRWSIAECFGHLLITTGESIPSMEALVAKAEAQSLRSSGPFKRTWFGDLFIRAVEPPYRVIRVKTFKYMIPAPDRPLVEVVPAFLELQERVRELIRRADGLDLGAVTHKVPAGVNLTLGQWFEFVAAHERRHLWQARNVRNLPLFPSI